MNDSKTETPRNTLNKPVLSTANFNHQQSSLDDVVTVDTLQESRPDLFTKPQLNWLLKTRHKNGLEQLGAVLKISRKLYVRKSIFIDWFLKQKAGNS